LPENHRPPAAIGSSSDSVTGGGKLLFIPVTSFFICQNRQPPAAIGSSSDSVTGGGKILISHLSL
jgi:hypothetical protein